MKVYMMYEIDCFGMIKVIEEIFDYLLVCDGVYFSFDLDGFDLNDVLGVGIFVVGGISYWESYLVMEMLYDVGIIILVEFVEVNLIFDYENKIG